MREFGRSLHGKPKMRQTHVALHCYCRRLAIETGCPRSWLAYNYLTTTRTHLPEELRHFLSRRFPDEAYACICSRLGYLRRELRRFYLDHGSSSDP